MSLLTKETAKVPEAAPRLAESEDPRVVDATDPRAPDASVPRVPHSNWGPGQQAVGSPSSAEPSKMMGRRSTLARSKDMLAPMEAPSFVAPEESEVPAELSSSAVQED